MTAFLRQRIAIPLAVLLAVGIATWGSKAAAETLIFGMTPASGLTACPPSGVCTAPLTAPSYTATGGVQDVRVGSSGSGNRSQININQAAPTDSSAQLVVSGYNDATSGTPQAGATTWIRVRSDNADSLLSAHSAGGGDMDLQCTASGTSRLYLAGTGASIEILSTGSVTASGTDLVLSASAGNGIILGTGSARISNSYRATATLATAAIAAGTTVAQTIAVTGAAAGAECIVGGSTTLEAGLLQTCVVTSAGNVQLRTGNNSTGSITPAAAQTVSVRVFNP